MSAPIVLRAQSGPQIGIGHLARTRAVAQALKRRAASLQILVDDRGSREAMRAEGFEATTVADCPDWHHLPAQIVWLDGVAAWNQESAAFDNRSTPFVLVDSRSDARERAWRVIYPNLHHRADDWDRTHPERVLAGPEWIPFAEELAAPDPAPEKDVDLLVTFGGADPYGLTERCLRILPAHFGRVVVVVGPYMRRRLAAVKDLARARNNTEVVVVPDRLALWMARSHVALTALGTTLHELALLGVPALVLANYERDREPLEVYREVGVHQPIGVHTELDDAQLREALAESYQWVRSKAAPRVAGLGDGADRIAELLMAGGVV